MLRQLAIFGFALFATCAADCGAGRDPGNAACASPQGGQRFYFDAQRRVCQPFTYRGCGGNDNRFETRAACLQSCQNATISQAGPIALCPAGNPAAVDAGENRVSCQNCPHGYECQGNLCCANRETTCSLQYDAGRYVAGRSHTTKYFYNPAMQSCILFTYFGSQGNANNFDSFNQCMQYCKPQ
ncbi:unnamed protein product, partial [Mesorhabditis spiculigera]